jgi:hypothetical protein
VPVCPVATGVPAAVRSYFTFAWLLEVSVTDSTLDETCDARGLAENDEIADENCEPFCSNWTRLLFGVEGLKNACQLAVICAIAELPPDALEVAVADDEVAVAAGAEVAVELELEPLLEQAVIARANTRPTAGAR